MVLKLQTSSSFRAISKMISIIAIYLNLNIKSPSHVTITLWVKKMGLYNMHKTHEKADDWIIIMDESIQFGNDKLLVVLGIRESEIDFGRPLQYQDLQCFVMQASSSWKGEDIAKILVDIQNDIGKIKYGVSDSGNNLKKALNLMNICRIPDVTHKISWIIQQLYQKDEQYIKYTKKLAHLRSSLCLSKLSYILPPAQRVHSRFMNLQPIIEWSKSILVLLKEGNISNSEQEKLGFVSDYKNFILELDAIITISKKTQKILKQEGLSKSNLIKIKKMFYKKKTFSKLMKFQEMIHEYLSETVKKSEELNSKKLLCTSDILESSFGKYKNYVNQNPSIGITDLCLTIPAFTEDVGDENLVQKAMEEIKVKELKEWKNANIGKSLFSMRKQILN